MGKPTRPTEAITYEQAKRHESSHTKWYNFHGYITHIKELALIFGIPHMTLSQRLKSGWPLEAALTADPKQQWTINNVQYFQANINVKDIIKVLENHFNPKSPKTEKGKMGVTLKDAIDGGAY